MSIEPTILAIDPGNTESGWCLVRREDYKPLRFGKVANMELLELIQASDIEPEAVAIEMVASYGMAVGREVFETCVWIGRFWQAAVEYLGDIPIEFVYRLDEKLTLCHSPKANDSTIRQALVDRFAAHDLKTGKGTKADPDWFYGFARDVWSAYCVGVVWLDKQKEHV